MEKLEFVVGTVLPGVITVLVFIAAVMRFFGHPLIWSVDLARLFFIWLCFIGAARAMLPPVGVALRLAPISANPAARGRPR